MSAVSLVARVALLRAAAMAYGSRLRRLEVHWCRSHKPRITATAALRAATLAELDRLIEETCE